MTQAGVDGVVVGTAVVRAIGGGDHAATRAARPSPRSSAAFAPGSTPRPQDPHAERLRARPSKKSPFAPGPPKRSSTFPVGALRFTHGVTRRANSVWPNAWRDETPLASRIEAVESFAAERGIAPSFQLTARGPAIRSRRAARRARLRHRCAGHREDPRALRRAALSTEGMEVEATVISIPVPEWLSVAVDRGRYAGVARALPRHSRAPRRPRPDSLSPARAADPHRDRPRRRRRRLARHLRDAHRPGSAPSRRGTRDPRRAHRVGRRARRPRARTFRSSAKTTPRAPSTPGAGFVPAYEYHYRTRSSAAG